MMGLMDMQGMRDVCCLSPGVMIGLMGMMGMKGMMDMRVMNFISIGLPMLDLMGIMGMKGMMDMRDMNCLSLCFMTGLMGMMGRFWTIQPRKDRNNAS